MVELGVYDGGDATEKLLPKGVKYLASDDNIRMLKEKFGPYLFIWQDQFETEDDENLIDLPPAEKDNEVGRKRHTPI